MNITVLHESSLFGCSEFDRMGSRNYRTAPLGLKYHLSMLQSPVCPPPSLHNYYIILERSLKVDTGALFELGSILLAQTVGFPVSQRLGGWLATTLFSFFSPSPFFSPPSSTFLIEGVLRRNKLIFQNLTGAPQNLAVDTFPDPVGHFGAPWRPYWNLQVVRRCRR